MNEFGKVGVSYEFADDIYTKNGNIIHGMHNDGHSPGQIVAYIINNNNKNGLQDGNKQENLSKESQGYLEGGNFDGEVDGKIDDVARVLDQLGFQITVDGAMMAALSLMSDYTVEETASHLAVVSFAQLAGENMYSMTRMVGSTVHGKNVVIELQRLSDQGKIRAPICRNDVNAIMKIVNPSQESEEWIKKVLSDPTLPSGHLAIPKMEY